MSIAHILCVDDDIAGLTQLGQQLRQAGYTVTAAASGQAALDLLDAQRFDLVMLDLGMPEMSGLEVLYRVRKSIRPEDLPIIMMAEPGEDDLVAGALNDGADDYVSKPLHLPVAMARIRSHLARCAAIAANKSEQERFALAVAGSSDGIWDWIIKTDQLYFSPRCLELLGLDHDSVLDTMDNWVELLHRDDADAFQLALRNHLEGISLAFQMECRIQHANMTYRWFLVRGTSLRNEYGKAWRVAGSISDISERKLTDAMTGLPNRIVLYDRINQSIIKTKRRERGAGGAPASSFGIILLQIDRYETMREAYGQAFCDLVQKAVAQRLIGTLRTTDTLTIMSENTMCVLVDVMRDDTDLVRVANRVRKAAEEPITMGEESVMLTLSIGMAQAQPHHEIADELIKDATAALNKARDEGGGQEVVFDPEMQRRARDRLRIEADLHQALRRDELLVLYQPIVDLNSGDLAGFEALVRWHHPTRGMVSPMDFIPIAEETGLIVPIGTWVLQQSCRQARAWLDAGANPEIFVSVNVSSRQLDGPSLPDIVRAALETNRLEPQRLKLEITESAVMRDFEVTLGLLNRLRASGAGLSLDDFGTGYSSLSLLKRLPIDTLKVDRSFVSSMGVDSAGVRMVEAILQLARLFRLKVVAEGIERNEEAELLRALSCEYGQGWLFGKPLTPDACMERLLAKTDKAVAN
ncbi:putative bifunctional diguanylate cyclase/phosphodiesterase [Dongia sedimenti]|uniref:EAL domain-containing protein n=1 Tax=Dongia sedimenti TaxID=3064282 RepID=A0ABU0YF48_9PROT|nr:EAL domain-containing protein [Rhodospirillaceae bacterium R-7]